MQFVSIYICPIDPGTIEFSQLTPHPPRIKKFLQYSIKNPDKIPTASDKTLSRKPFKRQYFIQTCNRCLDLYYYFQNLHNYSYTCIYVSMISKNDRLKDYVRDSHINTNCQLSCHPFLRQRFHFFFVVNCFKMQISRYILKVALIR